MTKVLKIRKARKLPTKPGPEDELDKLLFQRSCACSDLSEFFKTREVATDVTSHQDYLQCMVDSIIDMEKAIAKLTAEREPFH